MALKATVYRVELDIADIDRGVYATHSLTLARHPSETEERLMARLLAFALYSDPALEFCRGISTEDEPDLWLKDATGAILQWIEVGLPDERRLRRAAGRAASLVVLGYGGRAVDVWWAKNSGLLARLPRLTMLALPFESGKELALLANRSMRLQCTIQQRQLYFNDAERAVLVELQVLRED